MSDRDKLAAYHSVAGLSVAAALVDPKAGRSMYNEAYFQKNATDARIDELKQHRSYNLDVNCSEEFKAGFNHALDQVALADHHRIITLEAEAAGHDTGVTLR